MNATPMYSSALSLLTRSIARRKVTLQTGLSYYASRPLAPSSRRPVVVTIRQHVPGMLPISQMPTVSEIEFATVAAADRFLRAFNQGSLCSRAW